MVNDKLKFVGHTQAFELNVAGGSSCVGDPISLSVRSRCVGTTAVIYASDYLNKLSGERIERECKRQLDSGCRALVIDFRDTELVNSIGVSILLGVIDVAEKNGARVVFSDVNNQTTELFEMLGLTRHVTLAKDEQEALSSITKFATFLKPAGH
ncbi:MAG: STAS domain-containing protein [Deltaproteobacteria bacterium]|nr:MAG: STAS domain-containing protein [Deltaproteobacteria bacterium]